ncbi:MAG: Glu/Leu/Phe/Val dehydrogenase family protein [Cyanobacteria bacterium J06635_1]
MRQVTDYVVGTQAHDGGPAIATAQGVLLGLKAAVTFRWQLASLKGLKVAVQGLGNVGKKLCHYLYQQGAQLFVSDLDTQKTEFVQQQYHATVVPPSQITTLEVDVFLPCAMGGVIHPSMLPGLKAPIIAGCANNQLEDAHRDAALLKQKDILYCPDFVINSGGLINVYHELIGYQSVRATEHIHSIYGTLLEIFNWARHFDISTVEAAQQVAHCRRLHSYTATKHCTDCLPESAIGKVS